MGTPPLMARLGADPDALERLAVALDRVVDWSHRSGPQLDVAGTGWRGPDADGFRQAFEAGRRSMAGVGRQAHQAATQVRRHANEQRTASAVSGDSSAPPRGPSPTSGSFDWPALARADHEQAVASAAWITDRGVVAVKADVGAEFFGGELELVAETQTRSDGSASMHLESSIDGLVGILAGEMATAGVGVTGGGGLTVDFPSADEMHEFIDELPTVLASPVTALADTDASSLIGDTVEVVAGLIGVGGPLTLTRIGSSLGAAVADTIKRHLDAHGAQISSAKVGSGFDAAASLAMPVSSPQAAAQVEAEVASVVSWDAASGQWSYEASGSAQAIGQVLGIGASVDLTSSIQIPLGSGVVPDMTTYDGNVELHLEIGGSTARGSDSDLTRVLGVLGVGSGVAAIVDPADWAGMNVVVDATIPWAPLSRLLALEPGAIDEFRAMLPDIGLETRVEQLTESRFDAGIGVAGVSVRQIDAATIAHVDLAPRSPEPS